jgi:hypothetical protein
MTRAVGGYGPTMPRDRTLITVADLVAEAGRIVDPNGTNPAVDEFSTRYEDDDEPVRAILGELPERIRWGADDEPAVVVAQALVLYLAHRLDEVEDDPDTLLRLVARAEFNEQPELPVAQWFVERGIEVRTPMPKRP